MRSVPLDLLRLTLPNGWDEIPRHGVRSGPDLVVEVLGFIATAVVTVVVFVFGVGVVLMLIIQLVILFGFIV